MRARGQTLVMFGLMMLLLTLMVLMTLGLGMRIHERQEQQEVADVAAYSEAVVTARTFNAMATMNRTLIAQMSTVAAGQSLLSWAGYYHGVLNQARDLLNSLMGKCPWPQLQTAHDNITSEDRRLIDIWEPKASAGGNYDEGNPMNNYDRTSAGYIRDTLYGTSLEIAQDQQALYTAMVADISPNGGGGIAARVAARARAGSPWSGNPLELYDADQAVTRRERGDARIKAQTDPKHLVLATMATRGTDRFLSSREANVLTGDYSAADYAAIRIDYVLDKTGGSPLIAQVTDHGTSFFGDNGPHRNGAGTAEEDGFKGDTFTNSLWNAWKNLGTSDAFKGAWAQDRGQFDFLWPNPPAGCALQGNADPSFGYLVTTNLRSKMTNHMWQRGFKQIGDYREWKDELPGEPNAGLPRVLDMPNGDGTLPARHQFMSAPPGVANSGARAATIWPLFVDFNDARLDEAGEDVNQYGVPKTMVPIVRNYASRGSTDPWELSFTFGLGQNSGQNINLRSNRAGFNTSIAIATGLAYYHRGNPLTSGAGHAQEPPNFLNPFWRATLVASDVDESYAKRGQDVIDAVSPINATQANALTLLRNQGFEAMP